jgi:uncharacterized protein YdeI (YjbR/CyaY-like superfamily)
MMASHDPRVDAYIARSAEFARPILTRIRDAVHAGCPEAEETMKWGMPHFTHHGILCGMAAFREHCILGFWLGALVVDNPDRSAEAMGQLGCIRTLKDLPPKRELIGYVKTAAKLNEAGVKRERPARKTNPQRVPADLRAALRQAPKALRAFEAFPPSHRREYIEWITEAKRDETRKRRIGQAVEWIAEGKHRNWKYMARPARSG